eukprot:gnl/Hemi2/10794_TR3695_c0_g1_i1.p1 gnl/Hemi2/10794_TR3695_c0_g1~~gnl/Hemi2/10794_TR3695_c0_g1_i1.p1  ORF type:complete len:388 (+),score=129.22 gnl/Hemi2/10794_TR3695_c0_g1_i1:97-1164(+)
MAASATDERFSFVADWYDKAASLNRRFTLFFFGTNNSVELFDMKQRRTFLKRSPIGGLVLRDLFIGNTVTVFGRQLKIVEYADEFTRSRLGACSEKTTGIIYPDGYPALGKILQLIHDDGFLVGNIFMRKLDRDQAAQALRDQASEPTFSQTTERISGDIIAVLELVAVDAVAKWKVLIENLRPQFGDVFFGSNSVQAAQKELAYLKALPNTAIFDNCTLCIIKPHAVLRGSAGPVVDRIISQGFDISAMQLYSLDRTTAEEFLEVYRDVVPEYNALAEELSSGPCIAMEVRQESAVNRMRELCGPADPEIGKVLRPTSLRAQFAEDRVKNALHCTDLEEDGILEVEYFFSILKA